MNIDNINFNNLNLNTEDINIIFSSDILLENFNIAIKNIFEYEKNNNVQYKFSFDNLSFDHRIALMEYAFNNFDLKNIQIIYNIINFIKSYNLFADDYFKSEYIIINSLEELLDFKLKLKDQINNYILELSKYYISLFKSVHKIEFNFLDNACDIPAAFLIIFQNFDFYTLSGILSKCSDFKISDCYLVKDAYAILTDLCNKHSSSSLLFEHLQNNN